MISWFTISNLISNGNMHYAWYNNRLAAGLDEKDMNVNRDFSNRRNHENK